MMAVGLYGSSRIGTTSFARGAILTVPHRMFPTYEFRLRPARNSGAKPATIPG